jgi:hypothetical protein
MKSESNEFKQATNQALGEVVKTGFVLAEVRAERERQHAKWGEQNHPNGTGSMAFVREAEDAKARCQDAAARGVCTFRHILVEEVFEALAEIDPALLRAELVQVAAVTVQWIEAIDRRTSKPSGGES